MGAFYRTPSDRSLYQLEQLDKSLDNIAKHAGSMTVLAGDFNAGGVDWEAGVVPPGTKQSSICQKVLDICLSHGLEQQQRLPTRGACFRLVLYKQTGINQVHPWATGFIRP